MKIEKVNAYFYHVLLVRIPTNDTYLLHEVNCAYCVKHGWFNVQTLRKLSIHPTECKTQIVPKVFCSLANSLADPFPIPCCWRKGVTVLALLLLDLWPMGTVLVGLRGNPVVCNHHRLCLKWAQASDSFPLEIWHPLGWIAFTQFYPVVERLWVACRELLWILPSCTSCTHLNAAQYKDILNMYPCHFQSNNPIKHLWCDFGPAVSRMDTPSGI